MGLQRCKAAEGEEEGAGIAPGAEVRGMAQGEETRVTEQKVQAETGDGQHQGLAEDDQLIRVYDNRCRQPQRQQPEREERAANHAQGGQWMSVNASKG